MFVNTKNPYVFQSFLFNHPQRAICRALCRYYNVFCWFAFVEYLLGMWPYVYIIHLCVCLVLLSVEDQFHKQVFHWQEHGNTKLETPKDSLTVPAKSEILSFLPKTEPKLSSQWPVTSLLSYSGPLLNYKFWISGSWFRASAMTTMNKKPTRCTIVLKSLKHYCILIPPETCRAE
jgi:hypothetical protein